MHVVHPEAVRLLLPDWMCPAVRVPDIPGILTQRLRVVTERIPRRAPSAAGVFPLRLGRKPVLLPLLPTQPVAERRRIKPAHVQHRMVIGLVVARQAPGKLRILAPPVRCRVPTQTAFSVLLGVGLVASRFDEPAERPRQRRNSVRQFSSAGLCAQRRTPILAEFLKPRCSRSFPYQCLPEYRYDGRLTRSGSAADLNLFGKPRPASAGGRHGPEAAHG